MRNEFSQDGNRKKLREEARGENGKKAWERASGTAGLINDIALEKAECIMNSSLFGSKPKWMNYLSDVTVKNNEYKAKGYFAQENLETLNQLSGKTMSQTDCKDYADKYAKTVKEVMPELIKKVSIHFINMSNEDRKLFQSQPSGYKVDHYLTGKSDFNLYGKIISDGMEKNGLDSPRKEKEPFPIIDRDKSSFKVNANVNENNPVREAPETEIKVEPPPVSMDSNDISDIENKPLTGQQKFLKEQEKKHDQPKLESPELSKSGPVPGK
jgi:hypothetical protein